MKANITVLLSEIIGYLCAVKHFIERENIFVVIPLNLLIPPVDDCFEINDKEMIKVTKKGNF